MLIHAIPSFYQVFIRTKSTVLSSVLKRAIQPPVEQDALAAVESSRLVLPKPDEVRTSVQKYKQRREMKHLTAFIKLSLSLPMCVDLGRKHKLIEWFTHDLYCSTLSVHLSTRQRNATESLPISTDETIRIHRALYRFELYRDLFKEENQGQLDTYEARKRLLKVWPPWEVEELSCIHNYLSRRGSDVLDEVAEYDVETGDFNHNVGKDCKLPRSIHRQCA